jgi:hypothetical protein
MSTSKEPIKLRIPRQDLEDFSAFGLSGVEATRWADSLPTVNAGQTAQTLRTAISELNRVEIPADVRFDILEALRPKVHLALSNLSRYYLNQPVVLPDAPRKASRLAQSLYDLLTTGYTITAIHTIQRRQKLSRGNPAKLVCQAVHRSITTATMKMLVACQLYQPLEINTWAELHQLYALALRQNLSSQIVADEINGSSSVESTYLRALMLGCCKANQLRQRDLAGVYKGLSEWIQHVHMCDVDEGEGLYLIDLAADHPPVYAALHGETPGSQCRLVNTEDLVAHLRKLREESGERALVLDKDTALSSNVLDHLVSAWGIMSKRNFARAPASERLWVSVGLSNTHFYVSGGINFDDFVDVESADELGREDNGNPFMQRSGGAESDVWDIAFDSDQGDDAIDMENIEFHIREASRREGKESSERHPVYPARMVNVSPGGYCLEWSADIPGHIKTGDVIAVREVENSSWSIAVIRWVSQLNEESTLLGVELLSPRATPFGARVQHKTGDEGEMMRALLLPEIKLVGQPNTLITPRVGFKERQKITLLRGGEKSYVQLFKKVSSTAAYNQFEFRYLQQLEEVAMRDASDIINTQFESIWNRI